MKKITLPKELLNLPHPWSKTQPTLRREAIRSLSYEFNSIKTALNVLERSLHTLSELTLLNMDSIPEDLIEHWEFSAEWLAETIPTFDEFDLVKVEQFLIEEEGFGSPSPNLVFSVGEYWVWWITWDIEDAALDWVEDALMKTRDLILISRFLQIASRYWQKIEPRFAQSLLGASAMIGRQKALPLLERVEQHPNASKALKETARDYREFVLDNREKWLPDSDANQERLPEVQGHKRALLLRPQPAFGQLAIAHGMA
ncbi:MAG: hypothetical protein ACPGWR_17715 [Ardenticatenaceae bacterium]